jgi:hypothetical protein
VRLMSNQGLRDYLKSLPPDVRAVAKEAVERWAYSQDYSLFAERVLLKDEHGRPGRLAPWQKKIVSMPLGSSVIAVTGRQLRQDNELLMPLGKPLASRPSGDDKPYRRPQSAHRH